MYKNVEKINQRHITWKLRKESNHSCAGRVDLTFYIYIYIYISGLEKSSVLPVLDRFLKLRTDLFLDKKLKISPKKPVFLKILQYTD